jgi:hypothetical protein
MKNWPKDINPKNFGEPPPVIAERDAIIAMVEEEAGKWTGLRHKAFIDLARVIKARRR